MKQLLILLSILLTLSAGVTATSCTSDDESENGTLQTTSRKEINLNAKTRAIANDLQSFYVKLKKMRQRLTIQANLMTIV